ncbi:DUF72 domain-containing protein [Aphanothece hegewaldii CCALA 016]|uniref:DUF72 domain-containing protein n=1 Tax=Aphanothece hegewaldii CCALA 016 TaxID=2107694 RepID=A0A2T1LUA1_9CHRO|nr:DUF72 domain-containing protein [Aphanothece hegewaldii]PSF35032.1 DUF72 domain-containing protein [Aphanothece hegewaldii CCALA 016]
MTRQFYLGCAVWSYKGWLGSFYPPKTPVKDFLSLYSQRLTTVEGNTTFYAVPDEKTVNRWKEETANEFKFVPKFPKTITHEGLLQPKIADAIAFLERMRKLADRLGSLFIQLPPSYSPNYLEDLTLFLSVLATQNVKLGLEVRHQSWFKKPYSEKLKNLLENHHIARVLLDTRPIYNAPDDPQINSERRKPQVPLQPHVTTDFTLVRFISHPERKWNQTYLEEWVKQLDQWLKQGITVYFFVHCPIEDHSPHTARDFQELLEKSGIDVPPLPWNELEKLDQLKLF